ncbi:MAG TPA: MBL fold metallo-hydrolase [Candidatus Alistipes merdipullorum]|nr:MBL fold metallo-hydrolase [Candidatus Alistipes merdipullorum]
MKTSTIIASAAILLTIASCGNNATKSSADAAQTAAATTTAQPAPEGVTTRKIDTLTLITLKDNDGEKRMPNKLFYGKADSAKVEKLSPEGSVASSISCFVVETQGKRILFDAGNGAAHGGKMLERLRAAGIAPEQIDYIFVTHFHGDHIGGLAADGKPLFANAQLYVPDAEYAAWAAMSSDGGREAVETVDTYGDRLHRFAYTDILPLGVKAMAAPGHTPGHTVYQAGRLFIAGDLLHGFDLQMQDLDICPAYDMDSAKATESRKHFIDYIRQNKLITAGMHFPDNGVKDTL